MVADVKLFPDQQRAVELALQHRLVIITGAPGTGKTTVVKAILEAFSGKAMRFALCAPSGKAAKRMWEATGFPATTIHRLLEPSRFDKGKGERMKFTRCADHPLKCDLLVVDESSMLDIELAADLLGAVPSGCRVIFVGDDHQLPSVGPGAVLRDMLRAELPTARLTEIKRNAGEIVRACHAIKDGRALTPDDRPLDLDAGHNWRHIELASETDIAERVVWLVTKWAAQKGIPAEDCMVISPFNHLNERALSCMDFNSRLQRELNPADPGAGADYSAKGGIRQGDRVVRLSNGMAEEELGRWETTIVNGDLGRVTRMDKFKISVTFESPERKVKLDRKDADLALAYALSCHKMQGSEARIIILPMHKSFGIFPCREWVYTAFSRAKAILITVGTIATLGAWVRRETNGLRQTELTALLRGMERGAHVAQV
jgi:exodeoxyribonuclease V alpha subunit